MESLNTTVEQENDPEQLACVSGRDSSMECHSRDSSTDRNIQTQITSLANEVKTTVMSLSETFHGRLDRVTEKLSDLQRHVNDLENSNTNNILNGRSSTHIVTTGRNDIVNDIQAQGETVIVGRSQNENGSTKVKPQLYDGLSDIDEYLIQFNIVSEINKWNEHSKALHLASSLTGSARSLLSELDVGNRHIFSELVNALQSRFGTVNKAEIYRAQLKNRLRQKGETIPELAQNIRKLTRQAYPAANSSLVDTLALDYFIDSLLDSEVRIRLRECSPKNILEAETLAVKMEAQRIADRQRSKNVGSVTETVESGNVSEELTKITQTVNSLVDKVEKLQNNGNQDSQQKGENHWQNRNNNWQNRNNNWQNRSNNSNFQPRNQNRRNNWGKNHGSGNQGRSDYSEPRNNPYNQHNNYSNQEQSGNENRSSFGTATRPMTK